MFKALLVPGMPLHNNNNDDDSEQSIRGNVVADRNRVIYPDDKGARNFAEMRTFAATCEKNDISVYDGTIMMAKDTVGHVSQRHPAADIPNGGGRL